jgi:hypothetical protein
VIQDRLRADDGTAARLHRSAGGRAARRPRPDHRACAGRGRLGAQSWRYSSDLHCAECDLHYQDALACAVLVQLRHRRLRYLPRLRPRDRHRLRAGDSGSTQDAGARRDAPVADALISRSARTTCCACEARGIALDVPWRELSAKPIANGCIAGEGEWIKKVWYGAEALLRLAGEQGLQDAHPRAAVEVSQLHGVPGLPRRAAQARRAAVAAGRRAARGRRAGYNIHELVLPADRASAAISSRRARACRRRSIRRQTWCCRKCARG